MIHPPAKVIAQATKVAGVTHDIDRDLELDEDVALVVLGTVKNVGYRRTGDGVVEVRTVTATAIYELNPAEDPLDEELVGRLKTARRLELDRKAGRQALPEPVESFLVGLSCGHDVFYPEAWLDRSEKAEEDGEESAGWELDSVPAVGSAPTACPYCNELGEVITVALASSATITAGRDLTVDDAVELAKSIIDNPRAQELEAELSFGEVGPARLGEVIAELDSLFVEANTLAPGDVVHEDGTITREES